MGETDSVPESPAYTCIRASARLQPGRSKRMRVVAGGMRRLCADLAQRWMQGSCFCCACVERACSTTGPIPGCARIAERRATCSGIAPSGCNTGSAAAAAAAATPLMDVQVLRSVPAFFGGDFFPSPGPRRRCASVSERRLLLPAEATGRQREPRARARRFRRPSSGCNGSPIVVEECIGVRGN